MSARPFRVVALIAAFNEADVLEHVLDDLHRQGVEVYFIDDGSTDRTAAIAEARVGRGVIAVERPGAPTDRPTGNAQFQWTGILRRKEQLAAKIDADWFIHCDTFLSVLFCRKAPIARARCSFLKKMRRKFRASSGYVLTGSLYLP